MKSSRDSSWLKGQSPMKAPHGQAAAPIEFLMPQPARPWLLPVGCRFLNASFVLPVGGVHLGEIRC